MTALSSTPKVSCSICCDQKLKLDEGAQFLAIRRINKSIGWTHYDSAVTSAIGQKNLRLAVVDGKICGYALVKENKPRAYVAYIAVEADKQRTKIGTALMNRLFQKATKHKFNEISLDFRGESRNKEPNQKLINFWTKIRAPYQLQKEGQGTYSNGDKRYSIYYPLSK